MRVERLLREFDVDFDVCAFQLRPDIPPQGLPRDEVLRGRVYPPGYFERLREIAAEAGLDMKRPALIPNTRRAHEATEFARDHGRLLEFHRAVFRAYWEDERDIGDADVLAQIAAGCGLDPQSLREALDAGRYAGRVDEQLRWARAAGVTAVPAFIFNDRYAVVGAQDYEVLADLARRILQGRVA